VWLELYINLALGLLQTKQLTNGDRWTVGNRVIQRFMSHVLNRNYINFMVTPCVK